MTISKKEEELFKEWKKSRPVAFDEKEPKALCS